MILSSKTKIGDLCFTNVWVKKQDHKPKNFVQHMEMHFIYRFLDSKMKMNFTGPNSPKE